MSRVPNHIDGYSYYISNDSDDDNKWLSSSDDETEPNHVNTFLHGTTKQQHKVLQRITGENVSSSEDEFEKDMKNELDKKMTKLEKSWLPGIQSRKCTTAEANINKPVKDVDTDVEQDKIQEMSNEELFYDPKADDDDQEWADKQKKRKVECITSGSPNNVTSSRGSDAVLSCPACMVTLCMNCQRHEKYNNQFRAMFVMNCKVENTEVLKYKETRKRTFKRHKNRDTTHTESEKQTSSLEDIYHPVKCSSCETEVAMYDSDDVYHFFNVLVGHA